MLMIFMIDRQRYPSLSNIIQQNLRHVPLIGHNVGPVCFS